MHPAKKFFYVCAGLFLLALTFHLGARAARAQAAPEFFVAEVELSALAAFPNGDVYGQNATLTGWQPAGNILGAEPAGRTIVQFDGVTALASSGEVFWSNPPGAPWRNLGKPGMGAVNVERHTLGQLKARFRDRGLTGR